MTPENKTAVTGGGNAPRSDLNSITAKLDAVIEKITKSKKFHSVRILEEVKRDLASGGLPQVAVVAPVIQKPTFVKPPNPNGVIEYVAGNGEVDDSMIALKKGYHLRLTGATGCGKTTLATWLAHLRGQEIVTIQGTQDITSENVIGYPTIENGNRSYVEGLLPIAMQKGQILYLDEPNVVPAGVLMAFQSATDHRRCVILTEDGGRKVDAHPEFRVIMSMNEGYAGTHALNQAFRRRSAGIDMDYLPAQREEKLIEERTGIDKDTAKKLVNIATQLRASRKRREIPTDIGTASLIMAADLMASGCSVKSAMDMAIVNLVESNAATAKQAIADAVAAFFPAYRTGGK